MKSKTHRTSIADIALLAEVSTATVSRALNDPSRVTAEVRQRVLAITQQLRYRLNPAARDLARNRSSLVLLAVGDPAGLSLSQSALLRALASRLMQRGEFPVLVAEDALGASSAAERLNLIGSAAGALCLGDSTPMLALNEERLPTVVIDPQSETGHAQLNLDRRGGYKKVAAHLLERGHRRIGYVGGRGDGKFAVLSEALRGGGGSCQPVPEADLAAFVAKETRPKRLTGWVLPGETLIVPAVAVLAAAGRRLGVDTALVSQGDTYLAQRCVPPLTALRHPNDLMASVALDLLKALQENPKRTQSATLELELVVRASSDFTIK